MPYLTATQDHTQDGPMRTYAVTLKFAHTSMYVHSSTGTHSCAHTLIMRPIASYMHTNLCICAPNHIHVCVYLQVCTHAVTYIILFLLTNARTLATHTRIHTVVYSLAYSCTHTSAFSRTYSCARRFANGLLCTHSRVRAPVPA